MEKENKSQCLNVYTEKKSKRGHLRYLFEIQNKIYYCHLIKYIQNLIDWLGFDFILSLNIDRKHEFHCMVLQKITT